MIKTTRLFLLPFWYERRFRSNIGATYYALTVGFSL
jgi:hypothetical protein